MIYLKGQLSKKEEREIGIMIHELPDVYSEFYLTKGNIRLYIRENLSSLFNSLKCGNKITYCNEGLAILTGWEDKKSRKYLKLLVKNDKVADKLLKVINWNFSNCELFCKIKQKNFLKRVLYNNGFEFFAGRGKEVLLIRRKRIIREIKTNKRFDE